MNRAEISHALLGIGMMLMAMSALYAWRKPTSPARFFWPIFLIAVGFNLFFPAQDPIELHHPVGWLETIRDLYPIDLKAWIASLGTRLIVLHKIIALMAMLVGGVELARAKGYILESSWSSLLPVVSIIAGVLVLVHGIDTDHVAHGRDQLHHTVFAVCFITGGLLLGLFRSGRVETTVYRDAWPALAFIAGLDFAFLFQFG